MQRVSVLAMAGLLTCGSSFSQSNPLVSGAGIKPFRTVVSAATYRGRKAVRIVPQGLGGVAIGTGGQALVENMDFKDGEVDLDVAGMPAQGADGTVRGFAGLTFRSSDDSSCFDCFYLRFTNGRAKDPVRRSHAVQYEAAPKYPWNRLRAETPGKYEAHADMVVGAWTHMRVVVAGNTARLYVGGATSPALTVNQLLSGRSRGKIGLWIGVGTEAYFSNLKFTKS